jgi:tmRNA-binding protein
MTGAGEGLTVVPLRVYLKQGKVRWNSASEKLIDKRETERRKEADREAKSAMKHRRYS